jgi:hypothetical protein
VLPDASTGQSPGTLGRKLSRCKEGIARVFAVKAQILLSITSVAVQVLLRAGHRQGIQGFIDSTGAVAVQALQICQGSRSKSQKM